MNKSDSIVKLAAALVKAQAKIGAAEKGGKNPHFKSAFATLGDIMEVCKEPLNENGIGILQLVCNDGTSDYLETILLHESGEYISERLKLAYAKQNDPQAQGSAISYARRYALQSALFIPAKDDDGEDAMKRDSKPTTTAQPGQRTTATAPPMKKLAEIEDDFLN